MRVGGSYLSLTVSLSRGSFLKTWSGNDPCSKVLRQFFLEETHLCHVWLDRVPSQSNPADHLSRCQVAQRAGHERARVDTTKVWKHAATYMGWMRAKWRGSDVRPHLTKRWVAATVFSQNSHATFTCWHRSMRVLQNIGILSRSIHDKFLWDWNLHQTQTIFFEGCGALDVTGWSWKRTHFQLLESFGSSHMCDKRQMPQWNFDMLTCWQIFTWHFQHHMSE